MESLTTAALISALLFKTFEKGGEKLGEVVFTKVSQLLSVIREKFKAEGVEGKLSKAQEDPSEKNKNRFKQELTLQMEDDEIFAKRLRALAKELKSNQQVQSFFKNIDIKGSVEIGDIEQTITSPGAVQQEAVTDVKVGGDFKVGDVTQQG